MAQGKSGADTIMMGNYGLEFVYAAAHLMLAYFVIFDVVLDANVMKYAGAVLSGGAVGTVFTILITEIPGPIWKARLLYLKWQYPLPGHRAFSTYMARDVGHRIDVAKLKERYAREKLESLPSEDQNRVWYGFLQKHSSLGSVTHTHRLFLLFRDLAWISLLLFISLVVVAARTNAAATPTHALEALFVAEFAIIWFLARRAGVDLVQTVLAVESRSDS